MIRDILLRGAMARLTRGIAVLSVLLLASCATPSTRRAYVAEPLPCADSTYIQLKRQHPDSLTERAWERLQILDSGCAVAREKTYRETSAMMGSGRSAGMGLGALIMLAMVIAMW